MLAEYVYHMGYVLCEDKKKKKKGKKKKHNSVYAGGMGMKMVIKEVSQN